MALITGVALFFVSVLAAALSRQLTDEFKAWLPWILERIIRSAVDRLPKDQRERFEEEWLSHVDEVPGEIGKICSALGFRSAARKMTTILSTGRERATVSDLVIRAFDLTFSAVTVLFFGPLFLLIALCVWLEKSGPVIGTAEEIVGLHGRIFKRYRFSTSGRRVGKLLSDSGLCDQAIFLNLLRGDMALVGPRPEEPYVAGQLSRLFPRYSERTTVRPGMISWALLNRGLADPGTELSLDLFYVENRSLKLNLLILGRFLKMLILTFRKHLKFHL